MISLPIRSQTRISKRFKPLRNQRGKTSSHPEMSTIGPFTSESPELSGAGERLKKALNERPVGPVATTRAYESKRKKSRSPPCKKLHLSPHRRSVDQGETLLTTYTRRTSIRSGAVSRPADSFPSFHPEPIEESAHEAEDRCR